MCVDCGDWLAKGWVTFHNGCAARRRKCAVCQCKAVRKRIRETGQAAAHQLVAAHVAAGLLRSPSEWACVDCGGQATEYDHRDYMRPLDVDPVCRRCNRLRGPALPIREAA